MFYDDRDLHGDRGDDCQHRLKVFVLWVQGR